MIRPRRLFEDAQWPWLLLQQYIDLASIESISLSLSILHKKGVCMPFQDTRLYELCRWIFAGLLGFALAVFCWIIIVPWGEKPSTLLVYSVGAHELSSRADELREMSEISDDQLDELISFDKQLQEHVQSHYKKSKNEIRRRTYIAFPVLVLLCILLVFLSMWFALPTISLILAVWGVSLIVAMLDFSKLMPDSIIIRPGIYLLLAIMSGALWYYYCRKRAEKGRFIVVQVIATGALAWTLFLCAEAVEKRFFVLRHSKIVDELATVNEQADAIAKEQETLWYERQELLAKEALSKQEKRRYFAIEKEIVRIGEEYMEVYSGSSAAQDAFEYIVHQEVVYLVLLSLCVLLASLISCPLFIQFGLILAAVFSVLRYEFLGPPSFYANLTVSNLYIVLLALFLCFRLYRQQRECS